MGSGAFTGARPSNVRVILTREASRRPNAPRFRQADADIKSIMRSARVLFALFASVALAQAARADGRPQRWRPKPEQTLRFKFPLEIRDEQEGPLDWDMRSKVLKIEPNGDFIPVETTASNRTMGFLGQEPETEPGETGGGRALQRQGRDRPQEGGRGRGRGRCDRRDLRRVDEFQCPRLASRRATSGPFDVKADPKKKSTAARLDYEVIGVEKVGELDAVRVNYTFLELSGEKPTKANGYFLIDAKDGSPVGMETITVNLRLDEETQGSAKLKMVRQ